MNGINRIGQIVILRLYYNRLQSFLQVFYKSDIHVVKFEDLVQNPQDLMSSIYAFLNVNDFKHASFKRLNTTSPKKEKVRFSESKYYELIDVILKQKKLLETHFNLTLDWDLDKCSWVE